MSRGWNSRRRLDRSRRRNRHRILHDFHYRSISRSCAVSSVDGCGRNDRHRRCGRFRFGTGKKGILATNTSCGDQNAQTGQSNECLVTRHESPQLDFPAPVLIPISRPLPYFKLETNLDRLQLPKRVRLTRFSHASSTHRRIRRRPLTHARVVHTRRNRSVRTTAVLLRCPY